ncbi:hypothetical protein A0J61_10148, partial [Choanephora cucurbitarum]
MTLWSSYAISRTYFVFEPIWIPTAERLMQKSTLWLPHLDNLGIHKIWNSSDTDPVIYLGYPLIQSIIQRDTFFSSFIGSITTIAASHASRNLSVLGRATVANALILSKCWYILSVTPITKAILLSIQSVVSSFVSRGIFPRLSWVSMAAPRKHGGLGIIDITTQQAALFFRWLHPLLHPNAERRLVHSYVEFHCRQLLQRDNLLIPLLFSAARPSSFRLLASNTVSKICSSMDRIPRNSYTYMPSSIDCLLLPLPAIIHPSSSFILSKKLRNSPVSTIYAY